MKDFLCYDDVVTTLPICNETHLAWVHKLLHQTTQYDCQNLCYRLVEDVAKTNGVKVLQSVSPFNIRDEKNESFIDLRNRFMTTKKALHQIHQILTHQMPLGLEEHSLKAIWPGSLITPHTSKSRDNLLP